MAAERSGQGRLSARERGGRVQIGAVILVANLFLAFYLISLEIPRIWMALMFVPFLIGSVIFLQGRDGIDAAQSPARRQVRILLARAVVMSLVLTAVLALVTPR
ncbi:MAG: hypothetical protein WD535_00495 [Thermaerobacterales bacterium]